MADFPVLDVTIFLPLVGAILVALVPRGREDLVRIAALAITLITFAVSIGVLVQFETTTPGFQLGSSLQWIPDWGIGYLTGIDGISLWLILLTTFLMPLSVLASW